MHIGDSGYPLEPWLMTPYLSAAEGSPEANFNNVLSKTRNIMVKTLGVLKGRFKCLLAARELKLSPEKTVQIVNVCCTLHNICIQNNIPFLEPLALVPQNKKGQIRQLPKSSRLSIIANKTRDDIKCSLK